MLLFGLTYAQAGEHPGTLQPAPRHMQVPIWPGAVPDPLPNPEPESLGPPPDSKWWRRANNVSVPTMMMYAPDGRLVHWFVSER